MVPHPRTSAGCQEPFGAGKAGRGPSGGARGPAHASILNFRRHFCCSEPPGSWYFVPTALATLFHKNMLSNQMFWSRVGHCKK